MMYWKTILDRIIIMTDNAAFQEMFPKAKIEPLPVITARWVIESATVRGDNIFCDGHNPTMMLIVDMTEFAANQELLKAYRKALGLGGE